MNKKTKTIKILFISNYDLYGGSSIAGYNLHKSLVNKGFNSIMFVQNKLSNDNTVIQKEHKSDKWIRYLLQGCWDFPFSFRIGIAARSLKVKFKEWYMSSLIEEYNLIKRNFYDIQKFKPDIIHFNTGGGDNFFDLRSIKTLSKTYNVIFSLHDLWVLTEQPPNIFHKKISRASTYKRHQIDQGKINFISHSKWVNKKISNKKGFENNSLHFIQHGIDTNRYQPMNKSNARKKLKLKGETFILITCAVGIISNPFKDFKTLYDAYSKVLKKSKKDLLLIIIGDKHENLPQKEHADKFLFISSYSNSDELIKYYSCADLYIHSSHIETWGLAISEALSCGLPVIASSVGAIPEQVIGYDRGIENDLLNKNTLNQANGFLFKKHDVNTLYDMIIWFLKNKEKAKELSKNARSFAKKNLDINSQVPKYINYYKMLISKKNHN